MPAQSDIAHVPRKHDARRSMWSLDAGRTPMVTTRSLHGA